MHVTSRPIRARRSWLALLASAIVALGMLGAPAPATAVSSNFGGVAVDSDGTTGLVGVLVCVNVLNPDGSIYTSIQCTTTTAAGDLTPAGAFTLSADISGVTKAGLTVTAPDDAAGVTTTWDLDKTAAEAGNYVGDTWQLNAPNLSGTVQDADGVALSSAPVLLEEVDSNNNWRAFVASTTSSASGMVKLNVDFTAHPRVRMTVSLPSGSNAPGATTSFILTGGATGQTWRLLAPTITGTALDSDGKALPQAWLQVDKVDSNNNWLASLGFFTADNSGAFKLTTDLTANPRVRLTVSPPNGSSAPGAATSFILTGPGPYLGGTYKLAAVTVSGIVKDTDNAAKPLANAQVMAVAVDESNNQIAWLGSTQADNSGYFKLAIDFTANPRVKLTVDKANQGSSTGAAKSYILTVGGGPYIDQVWTLAPVDVSGTIRDASNGNPTLARASVLVEEVDANNQWKGFVTSTQADDNGFVKLSVDFVAHPRVKLTVGPPWQGSAAGAPTSFILTDANDPYLDQTWTLVAPNVSGVVRDTGGALLANAQVSLSVLDANGFMQTWLTGQQTDSNGNFSLAVDSAYLAAGATGVAIQVTPPNGYTGRGTYTVRKFIPTASDPLVLTGQTITLDSSNAAVRVTDANGNPLANSWVDVRSYTDPYPVNGPSNSDGLVYLMLPGVSTTEEITGRTYQFGAQAPWNSDGAYAGASVSGNFAVDPQLGLPTFTIVLNSPNLRVKATSDGTANGTPITWTGIEIRGVQDPTAYAWSNTNGNGNANLSLEDGTYTLTLRAPWSGTGDLLGDHTYNLSVANGQASMTDGASPVAVSNGRFLLAPGVPTISLLVTGGGNPVGGGWVEVIDTVKDRWINGAQVRADGKAGLVLADGTYRITAQAPWGSGTYSAAEPCTVTVSGGAIDSTTCGALSGGLYERALRTPNFSLTVKGPSGSAGIPFANVCVVKAQSWTCTSSNASGLASLFVPGTGTVDYQISPPWGSSGYATSQGTATKAALAADSVAWSLSTDRLAAPNVNVSVTAAGSAVIDGWVSLSERVADAGAPGGFRWNFLGGSSTGRTGVAALSVTDLAGDYCLEIFPGWALAAQYGQYRDCTNPLSGTGDGTVGSPRQVSVALQSANVKTQVLYNDGTANKWGYVRVEQGGVEVSGTGLNEDGLLALYLPDGTYDLIFYPGPAAKGTPVVRTVTVPGSPILPASVTLGTGNITGTVTIGGAPAQDAFVTAVSDLGVEVGSAVAEDGSFVLDLPDGTWSVKAHNPANGTSSAPQSVTVTSGAPSSPVLTFEVS